MLNVCGIFIQVPVALMIVISGNTLSFYTPNVYSYTQAMIVPARNYVTFKVKGTVCCAQWMTFYRK